MIAHHRRSFERRFRPDVGKEVVMKHHTSQQGLYQITLRWFLFFILITTTAFANEWVEETQFAPIIKQEIEKSGTRIGGLDNMISPAARRHALESSEKEEKSEGAIYLPSTLSQNTSVAHDASVGSRPQAISPLVQSPNSEPSPLSLRKDRDDRGNRSRALSLPEREAIAIRAQALENALKESFSRNAGQLNSAPDTTIAGVRNHERQSRDESREVPSSQDNRPKLKPVIVSEENSSEPVIENNEGDRASHGEDAALETPSLPKKYGFWDRPVPENRSPEKVLSKEIPEAPLTARVDSIRSQGSSSLSEPPSKNRASPESVTRQYAAIVPAQVVGQTWDDLNAARERARQALAQSFSSEVLAPKRPVNMPVGPDGRLYPTPLEKDLAQSESALGNSSANSRMPSSETRNEGQVANLTESQDTPDLLALQVKAVEKSMGFSRERWLSQWSQEAPGSASPDRKETVPMLRPRYRVTSDMSQTERRKLALTLAQNGYARGSQPSRKWRENSAVYQPAKLSTEVPQFYRHLNSENLPSKPRGSNSRSHSVFSEGSSNP